jgi:hypothetical protein
VKDHELRVVFNAFVKEMREAIARDTRRISDAQDVAHGARREATNALREAGLAVSDTALIKAQQAEATAVEVSDRVDVVADRVTAVALGLGDVRRAIESLGDRVRLTEHDDRAQLAHIGRHNEDLDALRERVSSMEAAPDCAKCGAQFDQAAPVSLAALLEMLFPPKPTPAPKRARKRRS